MLWGLDDPLLGATAAPVAGPAEAAACGFFFLCFFLWVFFGVVAVVVAAAAVGVVLDFELLEPQPATTSAASAATHVTDSNRFMFVTPLWTLEEFDRRDGTPLPAALCTLTAAQA